MPDSISLAASHGLKSEFEFATGEYALRVGIHGQVGRFTSSGENFRRGARVVCRTARGLEIGTVLNPLRRAVPSTAPSDGQILRRMTAEDQLLWNNLVELAAQSHEACQQWLEQSRSGDQLLEVEPLLDGRTLYFHFLNQASPETDAQLERLMAIFQETVAASPFAHLVEHGCGPGCGTDAAVGGCGTACHSCSVSKACGSRRKARKP
ncbi:MAG: hypothetical protein ACTHOU_19005 [Aureliella sp.]